ncbi:hypothetical protein BB560_000213 [Smittium megazygosporum]|uniref:DUF1977 domain-containing protein n=1 Tax=Smittium megazygosporum TaxID=133381 RepID=A0A2T9ZL41_9FUNG|nr:hypothetical protein BB560_000214 [Smittium megazygosporum]PVV05271.1 hypothetical protein BB560_000213 [Smittium megazygosporum]
MIGNADEAKRCLALAKEKYSQNNLEAAKRLAEKAIKMYDFPEARQFLSHLNSQNFDSAKANSTASPKTPSESKPSKSSSSTQHTKKASTPSHTPEQAHAVKKVISNKHDYYKVTPGADEAFKIVSHAFAIISDPDKRIHYDKFGANSDLRTSASEYSGSQSSFTSQTEMSAEELFNMFFGQQMDGFGFDLGNGIRMRSFGSRPGYSFRDAYGNSYRTTTFDSRRGNRFNDSRASQNDEPRSIITAILSIFAFLLLSGLVSDLFSFESRLPNFKFTPESKYNYGRTTNVYNVKYYVNKREFDHFSKTSKKQGIDKLNNRVVSSYVNILRDKCNREINHKNNMIEAASGWFGFGRDEKALKKAQKLRLESCEALQSFI